jgi:uncharacterized surface protein with fasciclin (FAS1) repeats
VRTGKDVFTVVGARDAATTKKAEEGDEMKRVVIAASLAAVVVFCGLLSLGQAAVQGAVKESDNFKILVPNGWEFSDFKNGTVQTYNKMGTFMVEVKIAGTNMTEADVKSGVDTFVKQYKGSGPDKVEMFGLSFLKTTFDKSSQHMSYYAAIKGGKQVSIQLLGPAHETDANIQAVLKSIEMK